MARFVRRAMSSVFRRKADGGDGGGGGGGDAGDGGVEGADGMLDLSTREVPRGSGSGFRVKKVVLQPGANPGRLPVMSEVGEGLGGVQVSCSDD